MRSTKDVKMWRAPLSFEAALRACEDEKKTLTREELGTLEDYELVEDTVGAFQDERETLMWEELGTSEDYELVEGTVGAFQDEREALQREPRTSEDHKSVRVAIETLRHELMIQKLRSDTLTKELRISEDHIKTLQDRIKTLEGGLVVQKQETETLRKEFRTFQQDNALLAPWARMMKANYLVNLARRIAKDLAKQDIKISRFLEGGNLESPTTWNLKTFFGYVVEKKMLVDIQLPDHFRGFMFRHWEALINERDDAAHEAEREFARVLTHP